MDRLVEAAGNLSVSPDSIHIISFKEYDEIILGGVTIVKIIDSDAALEGVSRVSFFSGIKFRLTKAIYNYRYERTSSAIIKNSVLSVLAIALFRNLNISNPVWSQTGK